MIHVDKPAALAVLLSRGAKAAQELCDAYDAAPSDYKAGIKVFESATFKRSIYAAKSVKDALQAAQHGKCAFCESYFVHVEVGDVEHFRPKAGTKQKAWAKLKRPGYYWLAYQWSNLFHSCKLCNERFKGNLFPLRNPRHRALSHNHDLGREKPLLVDPSVPDPSQFIFVDKEVACAVEECLEGTTTIEVLGLNRSELLEIRGKRLKDLVYLLLCRKLLEEKLVSAPAPEHLAKLAEVKAELESRREPTAEYSAMSRALLDNR